MSTYAKVLISVILIATAAVMMHETNPFGFHEKAADLGNFLVIALSVGLLGFLDNIGLLRFLFKYSGLTWLLREITYAGFAERLQQELSQENDYHKQSVRELQEARAAIAELQRQIEMDQGDIDRLTDSATHHAQKAKQLEVKVSHLVTENHQLNADLVSTRHQVSYYKGDANKHRRLAGKPPLPKPRKDKAAA